MLSRRQHLALLAGLSTLGICQPSALFAAGTLSQAAIEKIVAKECASIPGYQPFVLLTQRDVQRIVDALLRAGWQSPEASELAAAALPEKSLLVSKLRTPAGRAFAKTVSALPKGYDRLDRLSRLSDGATMLDRLIETPDGYKLLDYLSSTDGGRELGKMLSEDPGGGDFNRATGRIYTQPDLIERLRQPATVKSPAPRSKSRGK